MRPLDEDTQFGRRKIPKGFGGFLVAGSKRRAGVIHATLRDVKGALLTLCIGLFVVASTWSCILYKQAADVAGKRGLWLYIVGNLVAALGPVGLTLALRRTNPNVIYAVAYGASFACLQLVSWRLFKQPLSGWQWAGVMSVGLGICLLQVRQG